MSGGLRFPWDTRAAPVLPPADPDPDAPAVRPKPRGRRPAPAVRATEHAKEGTKHAREGTEHAREGVQDGPDWLFQHLTISGPVAAVEAFAATARGSGVTPWQLDFAALEEDVFVRAVSQPASRRNLTVEGCRILARQFRDKVEARQASAAALVGQSLLCPFDLHALLPVPEAILRLGPMHPAALSWLVAHWGITDRLRQVNVRNKATIGRRLPRSHTVIGYSFFTHRATPRAAIGYLAKRWPALRFRLEPRPAA